ncbi:hypothetical protein ACP70R_038306 [Stipagrostis hirtigluma subsp. patula]
MDFMKVLDQTVREIKREVNLKVLKVPEIEQKVLDATSDEPWGPHGSDLADIARATKRFGECALIMNVLWQRLGDTGANWRHVYKALAVIEYLLANGTERVVDDIIDNSSQIAKLTTFEYVEPNGKDVGLNVRKKAETVLAIVDDRDKLQQVREKAAATRDKYFGLSSTGVTYKSSAASSGGGSYSSSSRYGSTGSSREVESFRDSYSGKERSNRSNKTVSGDSGTGKMSKVNTNGATSSSSTKVEYRGRRKQEFSMSHSKASSNLSATYGGSSLQKVNYEDDDDFNPRASSAYGNMSSNHVDLFGPSLMEDLFNTMTSTSTAMQNVGTAAVPEVDLFANKAFEPANSSLETATGSHAQDNIDLFAGRSSFASSATSEAEFPVNGSPNKSSEQNLSSAHPSDSAFDPFQTSIATSFSSATEFSWHETPTESLPENTPMHRHATAAAFGASSAIPMNSFDASDSFGAFSSNTGSGLTEPRYDPPGGIKSSDRSPLEELNFGAFTSSCIESPTTSAMKPMNKAPTKLKPASMSTSIPDVKKGGFQVKSSIWADSLSRGLIDLNIASPKKGDFSDVGVVGQLSDGSGEKGPAGSTLGRSGFPSSTGTTYGSGNFQQQQFGNFE